MVKDESAKMFGVCLLFFGVGLFLTTQIEHTNIPYIALGIIGTGLFLVFIAKPALKSFGNSMKEISESL